MKKLTAKRLAEMLWDTFSETAHIKAVPWRDTKSWVRDWYIDTAKVLLSKLEIEEKPCN